MRYQGSKKRMVKILKALIEKNLSLGDFYFEPFAGGMNVMSEIDWKYKIANDINPYVIALWKDIQMGQFNELMWNFCKNLTKEQYHEVKNAYKSNEQYKEQYAALIGYVGTACSYGGGWWAGYANFNPKKNENHILEAYNGIQAQIINFKHLNAIKMFFTNKEYHDVLAEFPNSNGLIYCDPPYANTREYANSFDNDKFWKWAGDEVRKGNKVIVSEYTAPEDWVCIWSKNMQDGMNSDSTKRKVEKIFVHKSQKKMIKI